MKVCGDSLSGEGILDGDLLVVKRTFEAAEVRDGRLVVCLLPTGRSVVKRIYIEGERVRLCSSNSHYKDLIFDAEHIRVEGIVRSVVREVV